MHAKGRKQLFLGTCPRDGFDRIIAHRVSQRSQIAGSPGPNRLCDTPPPAATLIAVLQPAKGLCSGSYTVRSLTDFLYVHWPRADAVTLKPNRS